MKLCATTALLILMGGPPSIQPVLSQSAMGGAPGGGPAMAPRIAPGSPTPSPNAVYRGNVYGDAVNNAKTTTGGPKQEPSRAPLPAGYVYDANGRIVKAGANANAPAIFGTNTVNGKGNLSATPGNTGSGPAKVSNDTQGWYLGKNAVSEKTGSAVPKQEPSKAALPADYAYDANGRIGFVGNAGTAGGARSGTGATAPPPQLNRTGYPNLPSSVDPGAK